MARNSIQRPVFSGQALGDIGIPRSGGFIADEFLPELSGTRGMRTYREMADNDPTCGAILFAIEMLLRNAKWSIQSAADDSKAEEAKVFVEEVFDDMAHSWEAFIADVCSMFTYGFAPMEIVWKKRGGDTTDKTTRSKFDDEKVGIRKLSLRAAPTVLRWEFDPNDDGEVVGLYQQPPVDTQIYIPAEKFLLFRTSPRGGNPQGRSLLRNAYRAWHFKRRIEEFEGIGVERDLAGLPVARIPSEYMRLDADANQKAFYETWKTLVKSVRRDQSEGIVLPSDRDSKGNLVFDFALMNTGGSRSFNTTDIVDRWDKRIASSVLADFIFLGQSATGSYALSSDKTTMFATAIGGFMRLIASVINGDLLPRLWYLNGLKHDLMPIAVPGDIEREDLDKIGSLIERMTGAGARMFPDRELENDLRERAGLPKAPEEGEDDFLADPRYAVEPPQVQEDPPAPAAESPQAELPLPEPKTRKKRS